MQPRPQPPLTIHLGAEYKDMLKRVVTDNQRALVKVDDDTEAYLISRRDFEEVERIRAEAKSDLFSLIDDMRRAASDHSPEEVQQAIEEALAASRSHAT